MHAGLEPVYYAYIFLGILSLGFVVRVVLSSGDKQQIGADMFLKAQIMPKCFATLLWGTAIPITLAVVLDIVGAAFYSNPLIVAGSLLHIVALSVMTFVAVRMLFTMGGR